MEHYLSWESKILKKYKQRPLGATLLSLGLVLLILGSVNYFRIRRLSFSSTPPPAAAAAENTDIPLEVMIPSLNIDLAVDPGNIMDGVWQVSSSNATFLTSSAAPASAGNTVIYGHNLKKIFGPLPYIKKGEKITVKSKSGNIYSYVVESTHLVSPDRVDLVSPSTKRELTIYTCTGFADTKRFVVKAVPIDTN